MHPNPAFRADPAALLAAAERIGFAHIFAATPDGPMVVHTPVTLHDGVPRFHVARGNRVTRHLDGATILLSFAEVDGYISTNWYAAPGDQVPTWNYVTIEVDGVARAIDDVALVEQLDRLAAVHEPADNPWHWAKMDTAVFAKLLTAIRGFEVAVTGVRGTTKLSQNKGVADRVGVVEGLRRQGNESMADRIAALP